MYRDATDLGEDQRGAGYAALPRVVYRLMVVQQLAEAIGQGGRQGVDAPDAANAGRIAPIRDRPHEALRVARLQGFEGPQVMEADVRE